MSLLAGVTGFTSLAFLLLGGVLLAAGVPQSVLGSNFDVSESDDVWKVTQSVTLVFGALGLVAASVITYHRQKTQERQVDAAYEQVRVGHSQMQTAQHQLDLDRSRFAAEKKLAQEAGRQTRYAEGAQMLAADPAAVRIGGLVVIAALGREVEASDPLRQACLDLICAHLRGSAALTGADPSPGTMEYPPFAVEALRLIPTLLHDPESPLLGSGLSLDLHGTNIQGLNLDGCCLARADFTSSRFSHETSFRRACFTQEVNFGGAVFENNAIFKNTVFMAEAQFRGAAFRANALFSGAQFQMMSRFDFAKFSGRTSTSAFNKTTFIGDADFGHADFGAFAFFDAAVFFRRAFLSGTRFRNQASFRHTRFPAYPEGADAPDLRGAEFSGCGAPFEEANFGGLEERGEYNSKPPADGGID